MAAPGRVARRSLRRKGVGRETELVCPDPMAFALDVLALWDLRLTAAKDRTFETVRPNQGTASRTVPIRRWPSL